MRWPRLSIRATLLAGIVVGVVLPAVLVIALDAALARRAQEPIVERSRAAVMVLAAAVLTEPAWTLSAPALETALQRILQEPAVCEAAVLDLQPQAEPLVLHGRSCGRDRAVVFREAPVMHEGQTIARLRLGFDDSEIDRLLAERRGVTTWLVAAQVLFGVAVLAGVLSLRLLRPIDALKRQASRLAARDPEPPPPWPAGDELGALGRDLNAVQGQIRSLIVELERKNAELHTLAMHDHLTGLPNRTLLRELFLHAAAGARRDARPMALLFVDLDHFKAVNDTRGHAAGDELLVAMARRIRDALRESDVVCRMGGDEFLVLLPRLDGWEQALATAERVAQAIRQPVQLHGEAAPVRLNASIGIALHPSDGEGFDELVHAADVAMYRAKETGRGRCNLYHPEMDSALRQRLDLERELRDAIEQGQLRMHVQPIVDAREGRVVGGEALVRWQHPQRGLLAPAAFIAAAEETGLVRPLGSWMLERACAQLGAWHGQGRADLHLSVNVSALQLREPGFAAEVGATMRRHGVPPGALVLELTETTLLADSEGLPRILAAVRETGVQLAIDDFGTGFSSLSALKLVRPQLLKIDRSFVRDLPDQADDCALAEAIFGMGRALGIEVVAEGVEQDAQRDWLLARGARRQQGYRWSPPVAVEDFEALLDKAPA